MNKVLIGDCAEILKTLEDDSIDCIVTDPPYGYSFMGLNWDKALPSHEALKECCRVLKAGAFGFFMCAPRQDVLSRMIIKLEDAGFNIGFSSIYWAYASGFPKASAIDKLIDKRNGRKPEEYKALGDYLRTQRELKGLSQKEIAVNFPSKTGGLTGCYWNWENAANVPTLEQWRILKELLDLDSRFDELIEREEAEREVIKYRKMVQGGGNSLCLRMGEAREVDANITAPATDKAREFSGAFAGCQLKPALECIITVMKPLSEKTYVDQALKNGKGCTWLGECKIPYSNDSDGRFPANLLCSDDCLDNGIITKSTGGKNLGGGVGKKVYGNYSGDAETAGSGGYKDAGDFSRYFSLDAWFENKIKELPEHIQKTFPFLITPKPSKSEKNKYIENKHPTVKPLKLMSYLITMGSREGDTILDPYAGSGTVGEACTMLGRNSILIEMNPEYEPLITARASLNVCTLDVH